MIKGRQGEYLYSQVKIRPFISITGLYLLRGWLLLAKRQTEKLVGIKVTPRVTVASLFSVVVLPMAYSAAYEPTLPEAAPPVIEASTINSWQGQAIGQATGLESEPRVNYAPGSLRNGYAYGNCTYYVASRRFVPRGWGNARTWKQRAVASGYQVGKTPVKGAIAWTPFGRYGHVALVESVNGNMVTVSEMNYLRWNRVTSRTVSASSFEYIY